jgi:hypothetical protein
VALLVTSLIIRSLFCFFGHVWPPFSGSNYYPCILWVLGTNCSRIYHSFPTWWSPYSFQCNNTCWDRYFLVLNGTTRCPNHVTPKCPLPCPTLWKPIGSILPLVTSFFGGLLTQARVCFPFNKHSFEHYVNTSLLMCTSRGKCLVIN